MLMELNLCPKVDEDLKGLRTLKHYIRNSLEVQLLTLDTEKHMTMVNKILNENRNITYLTLHLPISSCDIEDILSNRMLCTSVYQLIFVCNVASKKYKININILMHCSTPHEKLVFRGWEVKLRELLCICDNDVNVLLENTIAIQPTTFKIEPAMDVVDKMNHPRLYMCLDICHLHYQTRLQKMCIQDSSEYYTNTLKSKRIKQVHFSSAMYRGSLYSVDNHSNTHVSLSSCMDDIYLLKTLGIESTYIVPEVYEDDYNTRENEIKEIQLLKEGYTNGN